MSGFSPEWLALREPVDHRSRDANLAQHVRSRFDGRASICVVDVGCGTGSNLRGSFHLLPDEQHWTLVDYDPRLLAAARHAIAAWADNHDAAGDALNVRKASKRLHVTFRRADLTTDLDDALGPNPDLVTASAFFDLGSPAFIERFAGAVARRKAVFFTVLTYNGIQTWSPPHAADNAMLQAFCAHQGGDKGFGASSGPAAAAALRQAFLSAGYDVREGDSPWILGASDAQLIRDLATGFAGAAAETGQVAQAAAAAWLAEVRTGAVVGHTDTLAIPR
ncbi:MAG: SAM-dependent methyltransferase [Hyphomicrobiaceae bacterium]